jgi:hypothetical protein
MYNGDNFTNIVRWDLSDPVNEFKPINASGKVATYLEKQETNTRTKVFRRCFKERKIYEWFKMKELIEKDFDSLKDKFIAVTR